MATVRESKNSPFWIADVALWVPSESHKNGGYLKETTRSTRVRVEPGRASKERALKVANEMEASSRELKNSTLPAKAFFESRVAAMMRAAGVEPPHKNETWSNFHLRWLDDSTAGDSSLIKYKTELAHFTKFLGSRGSHDLRTITPEDMSRFRKSMLSRGLAESTVNQACKRVRSVFISAHLLGYVDSNPGALLVLSSDDEVFRLPFTLEDLTAIFKSLIINPGDSKHVAMEKHEWRTASLFGFYYGMRIGDAVSRDRSEIRIENGVKVIRFVPEKKKRKRKQIVLPLIGELAGIEPGNGKITPNLAAMNSPTKGFTTVLGRTGISINKREATGEGRTLSDKSFHSFRHTINSLLVDAEIDQKVRQLICDHDDPKMNSRYTRASVATMAAAIEKAIEGMSLAV